ncbi:MAG TPA: hypothetical protein VFS43_23130 [Polyangiaceae bacterium]|nr:hypothetical protein [Polyangiaceae bacterium]
MSTSGDEGSVLEQRRDQMSKLVAKGFFNELVNYGVRNEEIVRVASHLLGNLLEGRRRVTGEPRRRPRGSPAPGAGARALRARAARRGR